MLRKNVEKKSLLDNLDGVFQVIDEICDNGFVPSSCYICFIEILNLSNKIFVFHIAFNSISCFSYVVFIGHCGGACHLQHDIAFKLSLCLASEGTDG